MSFHRRLIAVFALLCFCIVQQAALAHWAAHLGAPAQSLIEAPQGGEDAAAGSSFCAACAAFAGFEAALPAAGLPTAGTQAVVTAPPPAAPEKSVCAIRRPYPRAPPAFL